MTESATEAVLFMDIDFDLTLKTLKKKIILPHVLRVMMVFTLLALSFACIFCIYVMLIIRKVVVSDVAVVIYL